jgi:hypothetical protein
MTIVMNKVLKIKRDTSVRGRRMFSLTVYVRGRRKTHGRLRIATRVAN